MQGYHPQICRLLAREWQDDKQEQYQSAKHGWWHQSKLLPENCTAPAWVAGQQQTPELQVSKISKVTTLVTAMDSPLPLGGKREAEKITGAGVGGAQSAGIAS